MDLLSMAGDAPPEARWSLAGARPTVLFVSVRTRRFVASYAKLLGRLIEEGFDVHVVACEHRSLDALRLMGVTVKEIVPVEPNKPWTMFGALLMIQGVMHAQTFLICHIMEDTLAWLLAWMARRAGVWVTLVSGDDVFRWFSPDTTLGQSRVIEIARMLGLPVPGHDSWTDFGRQKGRAHIDTWLCSNIQSFDRARAQEWLPSTDLKVLSAGAGLDVMTFDPAIVPVKAQARAAMNVQGWEVVVGAIPRSHDASRLLLSVIEQMAHRAPNVRWLIEADADVIHDRAAYDALAAQGLMRFYVPEQVERSPLFYRALDVYLDVEQRPVFPIEVLEAASVSTPMALLSRESLNTLIDDGVQAHLLMSTHPAAIVQRLVKVLNGVFDEPEALTQLGERAHSALHGRFHRQEAHERLLVLYDAMLQSVLKQRAKAQGK